MLLAPEGNFARIALTRPGLYYYVVVLSLYMYICWGGYVRNIHLATSISIIIITIMALQTL